MRGLTRSYEWLAIDVGEEILEHRVGIEPTNTGFADQRVSHFATGAHCSAELIYAAERAARTLLWLCGGAQVGLHRFVAGEDLVCLFVRNRSCDDDIVALLPVRRRCDLVLRS
jgi:hypothetical protein